VEAELIASDGGVFEVEIDGQLVFSKKALDRFPAEEEIFAEIEKINPGS
jgi:selT/selW/selH-like putative selenoprotein